MTRRDVLRAALGTVTCIAATGDHAMAEANEERSPGTVAPAYRGANEIRPLPFDPAKLRGLSEKLIRSHHENNYGGAVKRLNLIQQQIGSLAKDSPPYQLGSLKREELIATNSMILHELYFGNLGGDGRPQGGATDLIKARYGSVDAWAQEFRQTGTSLGGGSGWVILAYDARADGAHTYWSADHTNNAAGGTPLLVMDMYEHSYHMDYGANARAYIDAFFDNVNWAEVSRRAERAAEVRA